MGATGADFPWISKRLHRTMVRIRLYLWLIACLPVAAWAHAVLDRADPAEGTSVAASPPQVRVWFDGELEPAFSSLRVVDAQGRQVSETAGQVDPKDRRLLAVALPKLSPGEYQVFWRVVSLDGHPAEGNYRFRVRGP
jgi:copper resistance protein C